MLQVLRSSFFWKLFGGYCLLVLLIAAATGIIATGQTRRDSLAEIAASLAAKANMLASLARPALAGQPVQGLQAELVKLGQAAGVRLTVITPEGVVLADSDEDPAQMDSHGERPEVVLARTQGHGTATRFSQTVKLDMSYYALAVDAGNARLGYVRTALPHHTLQRRLAHLRDVLLGSILVAVVLGLGLSWLLARGLTRDIARLAADAEAIAGGDYARQIYVWGADEIGSLAHSVNHLATNLKQQLELITRDRNQLRTILTGMVEGVVAVDGDERIVHINQAAARLFQLDPVACSGQRIWEAIRVPAVHAATERALTERAEDTYEVRLLNRDQEQVIELICSPLYQDAQHVVGAVLVFHDVSRLRRLESIRRDFVANVSHELKTPLTAIQGIIETMLDDPEMEPQVRLDFCGKLRGQTERLLALVNDLLALSQVESRQPSQEPEWVEFTELLRDTAERLAGAASAKDIGINLETPDQPLKMPAHRQSLQQAVDNLLDNAIKYTPRGGQIWLRCRRAGEGIVLEVQDTGIGIAAEHQERIFERFYRVDKGRSRELGGTGLGLSIAKHAALSHGGRIEVVSQVGRGSTFRIILPAPEDGLAPPPAN